MKKITLFVLFVIGMITVKAQFAGGTGVGNTPYLIEDAEQLDNMRYYLGSNFELIADIDLSEYIAANYGPAGWKPIGNNRMPFTGRLDARGYKIEGLRINRPNEDYIGLFGSLNGSVWNLPLYSDAIIGRDNVGAMAGECGYNPNGQAFAICCVTLGYVEGNKNVGGFFGKLTNNGVFGGDASICGSHSIVVGVENVGGFAGHNNGTIKASYSQGAVAGNDFNGNVGGFVGYNDSRGTTTGNFGELIKKGVIVSCYSACKMISYYNQVSGVCYGGFVGSDHAYIESCFYDKQIGGVGPNGEFISAVGNYCWSDNPAVPGLFTNEMYRWRDYINLGVQNSFYTPNDNVYPMITCHNIPSNTPPYIFISSYGNSSFFKSDKISKLNSYSNEVGTISPNPTNGIANIPGDNLDIKVYDVKGVQIIQTKDNTVDLSTYPSGVYIFNINGKVEKVIKQ